MNIEPYFDFSARICPDARISDLDETSIEVFRMRWMEKSGDPRLNGMTPEQLLRECEAITDEGVTYAALILFGKREALSRYLPQTGIVFEYHLRNHAEPPLQREEFQAGFLACFDHIWELINLRNDRQHYQEEFAVLDVLTFQESVVREAILNAVTHRDYRTGGRILLRQYPDRLVVESPGGFPEGITEENLLDHQTPRNRRVAEILSLCTLAERSGQGINFIYEQNIRQAKPLPDFTGSDDSHVVLTLHGRMLDEKMVTLMNQIGEETLENLTTRDLLILDHVYFGRDVPKQCRPTLRRLTNLGILEPVGRKEYVISQRLSEACDQLGVHIRKPQINKDAVRDAILECIRENPDRGVRFGELCQIFPFLTSKQMRGFMDELKREDRIAVSGHGRGACWFLQSAGES